MEGPGLVGKALYQREKDCRPTEDLVVAKKGTGGRRGEGWRGPKKTA